MWRGKQSSKFLANWVGRRKWARCHAWFLSPEICKNKLDIRRGLEAGYHAAPGMCRQHSLPIAALKFTAKRELCPNRHSLFVCEGCSDVLWVLWLCAAWGLPASPVGKVRVVNVPSSFIIWKKIEVLGILPRIFFCYITKWMFVSVYALIPCVFWNLIVLSGGKLAAW